VEAGLQVPVRVEYAARAILDLAEHYGQGLVRASDIARRCSIPEPFLEQVLLHLRRAGLIRSARGPSGGYELARSAQTISLGDIVRALGEESLEVNCMEHGQCTVFEGCVLAEVWRELASDYERAVDAVTVQALVERQEARRVANMYHI
jgi:Rrf2 family iron-sulfur cluster assembly transcriptional regulator